jgi:hypothetical protein
VIFPKDIKDINLAQNRRAFCGRLALIKPVKKRAKGGVNFLSYRPLPKHYKTVKSGKKKMQKKTGELRGGKAPRSENRWRIKWTENKRKTT